jgi:hypothetical protein
MHGRQCRLDVIVGHEIEHHPRHGRILRAAQDRRPYPVVLKFADCLIGCSIA